MSTSTISRLDRLTVTNFQSVEKADIELGGFTVIVGPSNSGKSALLRALRAATRNSVPASAVRVGKTMFTVGLETEEGARVSIERGKSHSTYRVTPPEKEEQVFTKAGRTVPDDVQTALAMPLPTGPDLVFSFQIDPPFLLSETGTVAAKTLGDLTNVSKLHEASREANRRRLEASKIVKIREDDAVGCASAMQTRFGDLPAHNSAVKTARTMLGEVKDQARRRDTLISLLEALSTIEAAERDIRTRLDTLPEPADIDFLSEKAGSLLADRHALLDSIDTIAKITHAEDVLNRELKDAADAEVQYEREHHEALVQAGQCPTCGQEVKS